VNHGPDAAVLVPHRVALAPVNLAGASLLGALQRSELDRKWKHHDPPNTRHADHRTGVHTTDQALESASPVSPGLEPTPARVSLLLSAARAKPIAVANGAGEPDGMGRFATLASHNGPFRW